MCHKTLEWFRILSVVFVVGLSLLFWAFACPLLNAQSAYQPNAHTLFYVPFDSTYPQNGQTFFPELGDQPSIPDPNDCQVVQFGNFFSLIPGKFGNAIHVSASSQATVEFNLACHNSKTANIIAGTPSQDFTVGWWVRMTQPPPNPGNCGSPFPFGCAARLFTVLASNTDNAGCRKLVSMNIRNIGNLGGFPEGCTAASGFGSNTNVVDGEWHSLIWVFDHTNGRFRLYIDGRLDKETSVSGTPGNGSNFQAIAGAENASFALNGDMDDLWIEDHAWSQEEVVRFTTSPTSIDIKPGSFPNSINPKSQGTIPVAILSSSTFDAPASVDTTSLTFGRTGNENSLAFCNGSPGDVNGDGLLDLMCHFDTQKTGFQFGDTLGNLKGKTIAGTPIIGSDSVRIVP